MLRDCRIALGVIRNRPQEAAHGPGVLALGRLVRDGVSASGGLWHAEPVLPDHRLLQLWIGQGSFRGLTRLVSDSSERVRGKAFASSVFGAAPVTCSRQPSPIATARQPRFNAFSETPTNAAYAPRRTFSAAYQGSGRPRIFRRQSLRIAPRRLKKSGPCERPRTKLSTSSAAHSAEKLLSVAPSATATRQRVGESEPRIAHASSYSDRAFPAFWQENASTENGAAVTG